MIPTSFEYEQAETVAQAISKLLESSGEAKLLAGGHSLLPMMKLRLSSPEKLIDISGIKELHGIVRDPDALVVGALTTHAEVASSRMVRDTLPLLADAAGKIGDLQVRNRGTVGGNLAHADMASDLPAVALALDAEITVETPHGTEVIPVDEFLLGPLITALPENSVLKNVRFKIPQKGFNSVYEKISHPASGYAVVGIAAVIACDDNNVVTQAAIGVTGAGDVAYRAKAVEEALLGKVFTEDVIRHASELAADDGVIAGDLYASENYRRQLCKVHTARALRRVAPL
ncbi:xanthine dehydrogenase family protein subunit M [Alicyclobacillus sp. SO9]|uniref:FAD binding domain-containing protein n=1 Tax=Alicyclobacillus sp. SO9 TaxID=2665646 RepID=UPI0018E8C414|nr:xanthine dehydrogenase family protein subunit M [Alicyclobacillus sp. SO9]QQE76860.1 xanthine dehydrogenase family protein subunit M [Alicyclobacillus sp. SO9]